MFCFIFLFFYFLAIPNTSQALPSLSVALDWSPNAHHTGLFVAAQNKNRPANLNFIYPGHLSALQLVAMGQANLAVGFGFEMLQAQSQGLPVVAIAGLVETNTSCFAWRTSSGIKTPKDWEKKRFIGLGIPEEGAVIEWLMETHGAKKKSVNMLSAPLPDFIKMTEKNADFLWVFEGWELIQAQLAHIPVGKLCLRDVNPMFKHPNPLLIANTSWAKKNTALLKEVISQVAQGYMYAKNNPVDAARILMSQAPDLDRPFVIASQNFLSPLYASPSQPWGCMAQSQWQPLTQWMKGKSLIKNTGTNPLFTNQYLPYCKK